MLKIFTVFLFTILGWKMLGKIPPDIKKCILVAAPHTSNFDFLFAMAGFYKMKVPAKYLLKREWVDFFLLRRVFKNSGALGVDRTKSSSMVDAIAEILNGSKENIAIMISPEGTRKFNRKWKTGFYYAALKARVPIVLSHLDYTKKIAAIGPSFMPSGCYRRDMQILRNYYKDISPKYPGKFSLDIYESDSAAVCAC